MQRTTTPLSKSLCVSPHTPSDRLSVFVRIRPIDSCEASLEVNDERTLSIKGEESLYRYDEVFNAETNNRQVFERAAVPVISKILEGIHGTIFVYGQTSSGKTHTMYGTSQESGLVALSVEALFHRIQSVESRRFAIRASFFEIYNEEINDLLQGVNGSGLPLREQEGVFFVQGLVEREIKSLPELMALIKEGEASRKVAQNYMNERSSRSHSIFRLNVSHQDTSVPGSSKRTATLNLVDLAGSESLHEASGAEIKKEAVHINVSLTQLKTVIQQLSEKKKHISYRNSALTKILKNSLGGNASTTIICTVTIAPDQKKHTKRTLQFGCLAKNVTNKPRLNEVVEGSQSSAAIQKYRDEINRLVKQIESTNQIQAETEQIKVQYEMTVQTLQHQQEEKQHLQQSLVDMKMRMDQLGLSLLDRDQILETVQAESQRQKVEYESLVQAVVRECQEEKQLIMERAAEEIISIRDDLEQRIEIAEQERKRIDAFLEVNTCIEKDKLLSSIQTITTKISGLRQDFESTSSLISTFGGKHLLVSLSSVLMSACQTLARCDSGLLLIDQKHNALESRMVELQNLFQKSIGEMTRSRNLLLMDMKHSTPLCQSDIIPLDELLKLWKTQYSQQMKVLRDELEVKSQLVDSLQQHAAKLQDDASLQEKAHAEALKSLEEKHDLLVQNIIIRQTEHDVLKGEYESKVLTLEQKQNSLLSQLNMQSQEIIRIESQCEAKVEQTKEWYERKIQSLNSAHELIKNSLYEKNNAYSLLVELHENQISEERQKHTLLTSQINHLRKEMISASQSANSEKELLLQSIIDIERKKQKRFAKSQERF
eukprot:TRINITY_DN2872_c0_g1_i5.p1 TRINITY_DN2872_c0_g1~~TRINITY_DN2872_c0_g1_i5.p1  ORF type:complete len:827 (-),score=164.41 TRINITY_DN2872_c0_g1_i5:745-3225(-)